MTRHFLAKLNLPFITVPSRSLSYLGFAIIANSRFKLALSSGYFYHSQLNPVFVIESSCFIG